MSNLIARFCTQVALLVFWLQSSQQSFATSAPRVEWTRQHQVQADAFGHGVALNRLGDVYVTGYTDDSFRGPGYVGWNSFLNKYDSSGLLQWTKSINLGFLEDSNSVVVDQAGDVYISGYAGGNPDGSSYNGRDVFLSKLSPAGDLLWSRQFGSPDVDDAAIGMTVDAAGSIYLTGYTDGGLGEASLGERDAFLAKYGSDGTLLWKQLLGSENPDESHAVVADSFGNIYVTLQTSVSEGIGVWRRRRPTVSKFDGDGNLLWQQQQLDAGPFPSNSLVPQSLSLDVLGNIFLSCYSAQGSETILSKLDTEGNVKWTERFNSLTGSTIAADGHGNVFLSGSQFAGRGLYSYAAEVMKLSGDGDLLWSALTDANVSDFSHAIATDGSGTVYIAGDSYDILNILKRGRVYAFVTKFSEVPEPDSIVFSFACCSIFLKRKRATQTV
jgi:Beta-propeller repeat